MSKLLEVDQERLLRFININKSKDVIRTYLLPFTGLSVYAFGNANNVQDVLVDKDGSTIYVILKRNLLTDSGLKSHPNFKVAFFMGTDLVYSFEAESIPELQILLQGRYTELLPATKKTICTRSKLPTPNTPGVPFKNYDVALQALYKDSPLRKHLALFLNVSIDSLPNEVVSTLDKDSIIYMENYVESFIEEEQ